MGQQQIPVFYSPQQVCDELRQEYSPSAFKPKAVINSWWVGSSVPFEIFEPLPATEAQLTSAHDLRYVRGILNCTIPNGFGNKSRALAASLPWTSGSLLSAARHVLKYGGVAVSPTSGFHHATYNAASGFCTFNGLIITAATLKHEGAVSRVGILDFDYHYGNGTDDIIVRKGYDWITNITNGRGYIGFDPEAFFINLPTLIQSLSECDLILYQAGADAHIDDPLGGFLTTEQLRLRDAIVFYEVRRLGIPLVWNLAGGYQTEILDDGGRSIRKILDIHLNTFKECAAAYLTQCPSEDPIRKIFDSGLVKRALQEYKNAFDRNEYI